MQTFYQSPLRFQKRIMHNWQKSGHVQLLRFAWIASLYWANKQGGKVADKNKINTNQLTIW